jgi:hypothetical protein
MVTDHCLKIDLHPKTYRQGRKIASGEAVYGIRVDLEAVSILIEILDLLLVHWLAPASGMENI